MSDWLNKQVYVKENFGVFEEGRIGVCTADLPEENIFAVLFYGEEPQNQRWYTMTTKMKSRFEVLGAE